MELLRIFFDSIFSKKCSTVDYKLQKINKYVGIDCHIKNVSNLTELTLLYIIIIT